MTDFFIKPYPSQYDLRGDSMTCYGSDFRNIITYNFNDQGYRSDYNFELTDPAPLIVCLGSSIATGHGVNLNESFSGIVANQLQKKLWNLGQGCFRSSNQTILEQVEFLTNTSLNVELYMIQFTHINRQGNKFNNYLELDLNSCIQNFCSILEQITTLLANKKWCWLLTDWSGAVFPNWVINHPNLIVIDPETVDHVLVDGYESLAPSDRVVKTLAMHPGVGWHAEMARKIITKIT
jgi:hypothetical protein